MMASLEEIHRQGQRALVGRDYQKAASLYESAFGLVNTPDVDEVTRGVVIRRWTEALGEIRGEQQRATDLLTKSVEQTKAPLLQAQLLVRLGFMQWRMGDEAPAQTTLQNAERILASAGDEIELAKVRFVMGVCCVADDPESAYERWALAYNASKETLGSRHPYVVAIVSSLMLVKVPELISVFDDWAQKRLARDNSGEPDDGWGGELQQVTLAADWVGLRDRLSRMLSDAKSEGQQPIALAQIERRMALALLRLGKRRDAESFLLDALAHEAENLGQLGFLQKETLHVASVISFERCRFEQAKDALEFAEDPLVALAKKLTP